jgi:hypothetical protein
MSDKKKKWSEIVLEAKDDGRVVFLCIDEVLTAPVKDIIKQPTDGLLWDLNRDEVTALTWMNKDGMTHWVNNFAVALVIKELKLQLEQLEAERRIFGNYAQHRIGCEWWEGKLCDCGLDVFLKGKK